MTTITQADRDAMGAALKALFVADYEEPDHEAVAMLFAAHREAAEARARIEGAKAMQIEALMAVSGAGGDNTGYYMDAIAALDPAQIAGNKS